MKRCVTCRENLPLSEFNRKRRDLRCRNCHARSTRAARRAGLDPR